jgi:hypothetical protein
VSSIGKLVDFTATHPVAHILGKHIEQSRTPFVDYPVRTIRQPDEHVLELSRGDLVELHTELLNMKDKPTRKLLRSITIFPRRVLQVASLTVAMSGKHDENYSQFQDTLGLTRASSDGTLVQ